MTRGATALFVDVSASTDIIAAFLHAKINKQRARHPVGTAPCSFIRLQQLKARGPGFVATVLKPKGEASGPDLSP
ncbi:MAG: hypothetical protein CME02_05765 [Geminicoccus sp.]|nr:hypothetical protein [Geminicoccus sp.]